MTPKERAIYLTDKYIDKMPKLKHQTGLLIMSYAKQCALIAVDEIISQWEYIDIYLSDLSGELNINLKYWYEVKQEIEKL